MARRLQAYELPVRVHDPIGSQKKSVGVASVLALRFATPIIVVYLYSANCVLRRSARERISHGEQLAARLPEFGASGERWSRFWRGEYDRDTLRSVPSWGVSVLLHSLLLLLLALVIHLQRGE